MATSPTTSSSGFDVNAIVKGLMSIERQPIDKLNTKESGYQAKLSALGLIKSKVDSFQTAVKSLNSPATGSLSAFKAISTDTSVFSASASSSAVAGTYSIDITTLAQANKLVAAGQLSDTGPTAGASASTVTFTVGTTNTDISIAANASLQDIRSAINAAKIGVTATIVNDGSATPYRLALSSDNTGVSNAINSITIQAGGDTNINNLLAYNPTTNAPLPVPAVPMKQTVAAQNADFKVNGIQIIKSSNTITDAIEGVTLTLSKQAASATLTVTRDTTAVNDSVAGFVKAYNELYSAMKNSSAYKSKSALEGDSMLRNLQTQMRGIAAGAVSGGTMTTMAQVGLTFLANGTLQLDSAKLSSAMATDFNDVVNLFNSATGYATKYNDLATTALAVDGTIANRTSAINQSIKEISTRRDILEARMVNIEKLYRRQYSSLDVVLSNMAATSTYLSQQLSRL